MRVIKLLFMLLLIGVPVFAGELSELNPSDDPLITMSNATNATSRSFSENATAFSNSPNAVNAAGITAFAKESNSTSPAEKSTEAKATVSNQNGTGSVPQADKNKDQEAIRPLPTVSNSAVSISDLNYLRSLIEARKLQVSLAKEENKLRELHTPDPALTKALLKKPAQKEKCRPAWPQVVSIQGVDGRLSATLSSPAGFETVRIGNSAGPGKVVSITPSKVLVRFKGRNIPLKFKE